MSSKFNHRTWQEAEENVKERPRWIVEGLVSTAITLLYGQSKVGKSFLTSALVAAMVTGERFLDKEVEARDWKIAIGFSDDEADTEHIERVRTVVPDDTEMAVGFFELPQMRDAATWEELFTEVVDAGYNFLILDNLSGLVRGSVKNDDVVNDFYSGVKLFSRAGIPVLVIAHETDHTGPGTSSGLPVGSYANTIHPRVRINIYRTNGKVFLRTKGNSILETRYKLHHGAGARFTLLEEKTMDEVRAEREAKAEERAQAREDRKAKRETAAVQAKEQDQKIARYLFENGQGQTQGAMARKLAEEFGGSSSTYNSNITKGLKYGALVKYSQDDKSWTLTA